MRSPLALLVFAPLACAKAKPSHAVGDAPLVLRRACRVELEDQPLPIARVDVGLGEPLLFLLDTGAAISLIDGRRLTELGLERRPYASTFATTGSTGSSATLADYVRCERLMLGELVLAAPRLSVLDDPVLERAGVDGILGQDLLARLVLILDSERHLAHLLPEGGTETIRAYLEEAEVGKGDWAQSPLEFRPSPFLPLEVQGHAEPFELELDTGARSSSLPDAALAALGLESIGERDQAGVGGEASSEVFHLRNFGLFGLRIELDVTVAAGEYGLLGMDALGGLVLVLDGPGHTLWLHHRQ